MGIKIFDSRNNKRFMSLIKDGCYYCIEEIKKDDVVVSSGNNSNRKRYHYRCAVRLNIV